jgi:hypothetical protein
MKDEYKESKYYKQKLADLKLNKMMNRIRKHAKGPNPLSNLKKKSLRENPNNINSYNPEDGISYNNIGIKEKRKRSRNRKNKINNININETL